MADVKRVVSSNAPILIAGVVLIIAAAAWLVSWLEPDQETARSEATKAVDAKAKTADGLPPLRALPPPGTDLLPPLRVLPEPASKTAAAPAVPPRKPEPSVAVVPASAARTDAPPTETPPVQTAKRAEKAVATPAADALRGRYAAAAFN